MEVQAQTTQSLPDIIRAHRHAWTAAELSDVLSLSQKHFYKLAKAGRIPCIRIGGAIRFDPATTANWLESKGSKWIN